ncbi:hypothetical protein G6F68_018911 [Rhizopus microsporus]|nr:hypothetical protein G6F68_018911 [Rhizopus microsporus]
MATGPHAHRRAQEHHADQAVHRQLFGPGVGIVQYVAGEELQEAQHRHRPEHGQADPVFGLVTRQADLVMVGLFEALDDLVHGRLVRACRRVRVAGRSARAVAGGRHRRRLRVQMHGVPLVGIWCWAAGR